MSDTALFVFSNYLSLLPVLLVWLIGMVIAVARWRRHRRVSLFVSLALLLFIVRSLVNPAIRFRIQTSDFPAGQMGYWFALLNVISGVVGAASWILILVAVFTERQESDASGA